MFLVFTKTSSSSFEHYFCRTCNKWYWNCTVSRYEINTFTSEIAIQIKNWIKMEVSSKQPSSYPSDFDTGSEEQTPRLKSSKWRSDTWWTLAREKDRYPISGVYCSNVICWEEPGWVYWLSWELEQEMTSLNGETTVLDQLMHRGILLERFLSLGTFTCTLRHWGHCSVQVMNMALHSLTPRGDTA